MNISLSIGEIPGGFTVTASTDVEEDTPRTVFCLTKAEAAMQAADLLSSFAVFLMAIAKRESAPKIVIPHSLN